MNAPVVCGIRRHIGKQPDYLDQIEERAAELLLPGGECYPWRADNIQEAVAQAGIGELAVFTASAACAIADNNGMNDHANHLTIVALRQLVEGYWRGTARVVAQQQIDNESKF